MSGSWTTAALLATLALGATGAATALGEDRTCLECHADQAPGGSTHPVGIPAPARLGDRLPTVGGMVACVTCHLGHFEDDPARGTDTRPGRRNFRLRARPEELCAACHRSAGGHWDRPHALYADTIHGGSRPALDDDRLAAGDGRLDVLSRRCLACHDDSHARAVPFETRITGTLGRSHPVGIRLAALGTPVAPAPRAEDLSRDGVRLFDGRVGCGSCHRLFSRNRARLAMEMTRSRLCLSCHAI